MRHARSRFATTILLGAAIALVSSPVMAGTSDEGARLPDDDSAARGYFTANGLLNRGLYEMAAAEYETFLAAHGDHDKAPVARYGAGVCYFRTQRYDKAIEHLTRLPAESGFEFAAEAGAMLGHCLLAERRYAEAIDACRSVVAQHGKHDLADDAAACLVEALFMTARHADASTQATAFTKRWPNSPLGVRVAFYDGRARMTQGDHAGAASRFTVVLKGKSDGPLAERAVFLLAQCYDREGKVERAIPAYRAVLKRAGSTYTADAMLALAVLLRQQGESDEAGELLDRLIKQHPKSALKTHARLQRGFAWFDRNRFDKAFESFRRVAESAGELQDTAAYWSAKCQLRQGKFTDAARALESAISGHPKSELAAEMYYDRAIALVRAEESEEAVTALRAFLARFSDHLLAADALYLLAGQTHRQKEYERSRGHCEAFLEQYPGHASAEAVAFMWGENEFLSERYREAVERFTQFLATHPSNSQGLAAKYRVGTALHRLGRYDEAAAVLAPVAEAAANDESYHPVLLALGDSYFQRGEWKNAERYLGAYLSSSAEPAAADDAWLKLGLARQRQGSHADALKAFDRLLGRFAESPHRLQALFERGQVLLALERREDAKAAFESVLSHPENKRFAAHALNHLGAIAVHGDDFANAADYFKRIDGLSTDGELGADALLRRGQSLMAAEKWDEADDVLARFLGEHPSHARAAEARGQLAVALSRQKRCGEARTEVERLDHGAAGVAGVQYELAWCLREVGETDAAGAVYRKLIQGGARTALNQRALLELAGLEEQAERYEEAASLLRQLSDAIESAGSDVPAELREQATYRLGVCEFHSGRYSEAAGALQAFVDGFPDSELRVSAMFFGGEASLKLNKHRAAADLFERVVKGCDDGELCAPSLLRLGESHAALQGWARSERAFGEFLDRFASHDQWYQARFGLGWAREHQKRYDEAMAAYRAVTSKHKGETAARAQFQIGECLFAKKDHESAARELIKVDILYAYPEWSAAALYEAGRCFDALGKRVEATKQFRVVVQKYGGTQWAAMAEKRLAEPKRVTIPGRKPSAAARQAANKESE